MHSGPLSGIRVLEFTQIIAGPFGCMMLADLGAEVIKVEPPGGEPWRQYGQFIPGESKPFQSLNRGKQSLVLDSADDRAREIVHRLIPTVDVVVINYRPDVAKRLGLDYETLAAIRPDLIYVDVTAFGRKGPWAHRPGYDIVIQAVSGMIVGDGKVTEDGCPEYVTASPLADYGTGLSIAWATSTALYHREKTGEGQLIETSLLATALAFQGSVVMELPVADEVMRNPLRDERHRAREAAASYPQMLEIRRRQRPVPSIYYRAYKTADGAIAVGALSRSLWAKVRAAIGTEFLGIEDPRYDISDPEWVTYSRERVSEVEQILQTKTTAEWIEVFERHGVPAGPVQFPEDLSRDPQVLENELMVPLEHDLTGPQEMVAPLLRLAKAPAKPQGAAPPLGRDTDRWLREAGCNPEEIVALHEAGVVG